MLYTFFEAHLISCFTHGIFYILIKVQVEVINQAEIQDGISVSMVLIGTVVSIPQGCFCIRSKSPI